MLHSIIDDKIRKSHLALDGFFVVFYNQMN